MFHFESCWKTEAFTSRLFQFYQAVICQGLIRADVKPGRRSGRNSPWAVSTDGVCNCRSTSHGSCHSPPPAICPRKHFKLCTSSMYLSDLSIFAP
ncbi:hypothetical protein mRhiFer1_008438 [Rhinolophus ferrumequinum]|uniref:Uncharacterized protein n=1 Tax=Rhinolophus ferrumequinum TaxID=59479 RepID=A0A7J7V8E5_RHIFE|nr:hypothetical protein mRhiFer1_008438 [Rhinolophus ferrumequinum]